MNNLLKDFIDNDEYYCYNNYLLSRKEKIIYQKKNWQNSKEVRYMDDNNLEDLTPEELQNLTREQRIAREVKTLFGEKSNFSKHEKMMIDATDIAKKHPELRKRVYQEYDSDINIDNQDLDFEVALIVDLGFSDYNDYESHCLNGYTEKLFRDITKNGEYRPSDN